MRSGVCSSSVRWLMLMVRCMRTNEGFSSESVAESSIRRSMLGRLSKAFCISARNPMRRHLSNSSSTSQRTLSALMLSLSIWSLSRPGVANTICGLVRIISRCSSIVARPPYRQAERRPLPMLWNTSCDCRANSLPGTITTACTSSLPALRREAIGNRYARVLPLPVGASTTTSLSECRMASDVSSCIALRLSMRSFCNMFSMFIVLLFVVIECLYATAVGWVYSTGASRWANHPTNFCHGVRNFFHFFGVSRKLFVLSRSNILDSCAVVHGSIITAFSS